MSLFYIYTVLCAVCLRSVGNARNRLLPRSIIEGKHIAHNVLQIGLGF